MTKKQTTYTALLLLFGVLAYSLSTVPFTFSYDHGPNYENVSIDTTVNVTDAKPEILQILINSASSITLSAGTTTTVDVVLVLRDYNGAGTIAGVNGTFYFESNSSSDPANNNSLYRNVTCVNSTPAYGVGSNLINYTCNFFVYYYAVNGTWYVNATVIDDFAFTASDTNTTTIDALYALNVTTLIDYGDMVLTDNSDNMTANITNLGNLPINMTVFSYGAVSGDGLAMNCSQGNISAEHQKFSHNVSANYTQKTATPGNPVSPADMALQVQKQTVPATQITNTTYWQLYVSADNNPYGVCNGTLVFAAYAG